MIRILIADDHAIVRQGLIQILAEESDMAVFGEAANASETIKNIHEQNWDIVILDITLPDRSGLDVLMELKNIRPRLPVLILSMHPEEQFAVRALKAGAAGYVTKESVPEELVKAIRKVLEGGKYVSPNLAEKLAVDLELKDESKRSLHETLSPREYQVMCMITSGKRIKDIAEELYLSVKTISTHRTRILEKMKMKNNVELTRYVLKNRIVD